MDLQSIQDQLNTESSKIRYSYHILKFDDKGA